MVVCDKDLVRLAFSLIPRPTGGLAVGLGMRQLALCLNIEGRKTCYQGDLCIICLYIQSNLNTSQLHPCCAVDHHLSYKSTSSLWIEAPKPQHKWLYVRIHNLLELFTWLVGFSSQTTVQPHTSLEPSVLIAFGSKVTCAQTCKWAFFATITQLALFQYSNRKNVALTVLTS